MRPRHYAGESMVVPPGRIRAGGCFNEAPALRRGKSFEGLKNPTNIPSFNEAPALRRGKFPTPRPRSRSRSPEASMRPRHYAGESREGCPHHNEPDQHASMRPRHYAGESRVRPQLLLQHPPGFNEAPALRRGKSGGTADADRARRASMRPRHYAGESAGGRDRHMEPPGASMRPRHYAGESGASASARYRQPRRLQ